MLAPTRTSLALVAALAMLLAACATPALAPTPSPTASASVTPSAAPATSTPSPTASPSPSTTPAPTTTIGTGATGGPNVPPGSYGQSCAKDIPWAQPVTAAFVCIDAPASGTHVPRTASLVAHGYAGGSFESNVVVEVRLVLASGALASTPLATKAQTYAAPDVGVPGGWTSSLDLPASTPAGTTVCVTAYFTSPRDGSRVAQASVDIVLD